MAMKYKKEDAIVANLYKEISLALNTHVICVFFCYNIYC